MDLRRLRMESSDFARLNTLTEKTLHDNASEEEQAEFIELMERWQNSTEFNLLKKGLSSD